MVHLKPLGGFPTTDVQRGFDLNGRSGPLMLAVQSK